MVVGENLFRDKDFLFDFECASRQELILSLIDITEENRKFSVSSEVGIIPMRCVLNIANLAREVKYYCFFAII